MTLTVAIVLIITSVVAFILYRKSSDYTSSQNLGFTSKFRKKANEKYNKEKKKDPCEWVKLLKKS